MSIPDISKFSDENLAVFLDSFDTILTDCDGVLWILGDPLDGAVDAVTALEALGKRFFYVTNNATKTVAQYVKGLTALGYKITESQVVTPAVSVAHLLREKGVRRKVHLLASSAFRSEVEAAGVRCTEPVLPSVITLDGIKQHVRQLDRDVGAVVMDFTANLTYVQMLEAAALLADPECLFVAGATDFDLPVAPDVYLLGPGYFVDMISKSSRRQPLVAGKPSSVITDVVVARHPTLDRRRTLFIGDSLPQDMAQGIMSGFITLLVLSGVTTLEEAENAPPSIRPQFVAPSLKILVPALRRLVSSRVQATTGK